MTTVRCTGPVTSFLTPTPTTQSLGIYLCSTQRQAGPDDISEKHAYWQYILKAGSLSRWGSPNSTWRQLQSHTGGHHCLQGKRKRRLKAAHILKFELSGSRRWGFTEKKNESSWVVLHLWHRLQTQYVSATRNVNSQTAQVPCCMLSEMLSLCLQVTCRKLDIWSTLLFSSFPKKREFLSEPGDHEVALCTDEYVPRTYRLHAKIKSMWSCGVNIVYTALYYFIVLKTNKMLNLRGLVK